MSIKDYAAHRGVIVKTVYNALNDGRLTSRSIVTSPSGERSILVAEADAEWASTTDPAMQQGSIQAKANAAQAAADEANILAKPEFVPENDLSLELIDKDGNVRKIQAYNVSRAQTAAAVAKMRELEYQQAAGKLVPADDLKKAQFKIARMVRDQLLAVADRIAPQCAAEQDGFTVHQIIQGEIRKALDLLTGE